MKCPRCKNQMTKTEIQLGWVCMVCGYGYREDIDYTINDSTTYESYNCADNNIETIKK